jgi:RHS repeat-associated protein
VVGFNVYGKAIDEMIQRGAFGTDGLWHWYFLHQDHEGSVTHITDLNGAVIEKYRYDAFGEANIYNAAGTLRTATAYNNRFMFTGREYSNTFGFYEYRARAYHPGLGRFMSEDPKGFDAGDYNLFRYCGNDPEDLTDPMGLDTHESLLSNGQMDRGDAQWAMAKWMDRSNTLSGTFAQFAASHDLSMGQVSQAGHSDPQHKAIGQMIDKLQGGVDRYSKQFPEYPSGEVVVSGLRKAYKQGNIRAGDPTMFTGKNNPFVTYKGVVYYNPQSFQLRGAVNAPRLAHDGEHLVDTKQDGTFARERRAYDVQHGFSAVVGPYQRRLTDLEILEIIRQHP